MTKTATGQNATLLLVNGIVLGAVALLQFVLDFAGYWGGLGPTGPALHGNLNTIGFAEAHGLAAIFAVLFIIRRNDGFIGWHAVAAAVHLLLGVCNLIFWPLFATWGLVPMGIAATAMHAVFFVLETWAFLSGRSGRR